MKSHEQKEKEPIPASLPVRECGLKCKVHCEINHWTQVTPRAGVWIEIEKQQNENVAEVVTPRAGVWIEIELFFRINNGKPVTPRAGVWIEIRRRMQTFKRHTVTPRAGVWIEITKYYHDMRDRLSLPVRECGLK